MNLLRTAWSLLFRLFPCPTATGLRRVGAPGRDSPVLVTCCFHGTVARLVRRLTGAGVDAWLLVADSKGVNVWCAAGAGELSTRTVVSAVKTSGVANEVDHRRLVLPPLAAPGVRAVDVEAGTGWSVRWGPVRARDLPRVLAADGRREEADKRVTWDLWERLDTALGSLFPFYLAGAAGFALLAPGLLAAYLLAAAGAFVAFFAAVPWLPGRQGYTKVLPLLALLGAAWAAAQWLGYGAVARGPIIIGAVSLLVWSSELGGLAATLRAEFDPFAARLGIRRIGNTRYAGTVRTDLLNGWRELTWHANRCEGCRQCVEVCPLAVWRARPRSEREEGPVELAHPSACTACRACLTQCPTGAIEARWVAERPDPGSPTGS